MSTGAAQGCVRAPIFLHFLKMKSWLSTCRTIFKHSYDCSKVKSASQENGYDDFHDSLWHCVSFERKENLREIWSIRGHSVVQVQPDK